MKGFTNTNIYVEGKGLLRLLLKLKRARLKQLVNLKMELSFQIT